MAQVHPSLNEAVLLTRQRRIIITVVSSSQHCCLRGHSFPCLLVEATLQKSALTESLYNKWRLKLRNFPNKRQQQLLCTDSGLGD